MKKRYSILLLVTFLISLIIHIPATLMNRFIPNNNQAQIFGLSGTIWNGQASSVSIMGENIGQLSWSFNPWKLLLAKLDYSVQFGRASSLSLKGDGHVGLSFQAPYVSALTISIPAKSLSPFLPIPKAVPIDLTGQLNIFVENAVYTPPFCQSATLTANWKDAGVKTPLAPILLSTAHANFTCKNQAITGDVAQNSNQLQTQIDLLIKNQKLTISGFLTPKDSFPPELSSQLFLLGEVDKKGRYNLSYTTKLN